MFSRLILTDCTREALANDRDHFTSALVNATVTDLDVEDAGGVKSRFFVLRESLNTPKRKES